MPSFIIITSSYILYDYKTIKSIQKNRNSILFYQKPIDSTVKLCYPKRRYRITVHTMKGEKLMLNEKIREYVVESGVKFSALAEKTHLSAATFSAMMNGKRKITAEDYFLICAALNVPLDKFAPKT